MIEDAKWDAIRNIIKTSPLADVKVRESACLVVFVNKCDPCKHYLPLANIGSCFGLEQGKCSTYEGRKSFHGWMYERRAS